MRPGGTLAPVSIISFRNADSSCGVLSLSAFEPPVVISDGNHPTHNQHWTRQPAVYETRVRTRRDTVYADFDVLMGEIKGKLSCHMDGCSFADLNLCLLVLVALGSCCASAHCMPVVRLRS
jgi:hypothetical protein